jgi:sugar lactone lactonase YvrE
MLYHSEKRYFILGLSTAQSNICHNKRWIQDGITVAGDNGIGNSLNQLFQPGGIYVDDDQSIYVADFGNHRIVKWSCGATNGHVVAGGNGQGNKRNQLNHPSDVIVDKDGNHLIICDFDNKRVMRCPRQNGNNEQVIISNIDCCKLAIDNNGYFYISDTEKHEVRRWKVNDTCGTLVAGGNGKGDKINQLNTPTFIFVDEDHSVYVSDFYNHRVMKWMEGATEGIVVAGGQGKGNSLTQLSNPQGVVVDDVGSVFVADCANHRIMRWFRGAAQGDIVVGRHGQGEQADQLNGPMGLSLNQQGDLYVVDRQNARVQRFNIDRT